MSRTNSFFLGAAIGLISASAYGQENASPPHFGTSTSTYVSFGPSDFSAQQGADDFFRGLYLEAHSGSLHFFAVPHLPNGAIATYLELDYCDHSIAGSHTHLQLSDCVTTSTPCDSGVRIGEVSSTSNGCFTVSRDLTPANYVVNNASHRLYLLAFFDANDLSNQLTGAVIGYKLQVSPAPVTPTFNDVPTTDPGFQYIEALAASGLTAGCHASPPLFCPDAAVTRRQVAIFLAKALGLSFN